MFGEEVGRTGAEADWEVVVGGGCLVDDVGVWDGDVVGVMVVGGGGGGGWIVDDGREVVLGWGSGASAVDVCTPDHLIS